MRKVLRGLGISNNYNAPGHQNHFHVFLNVPTLKAITGTGYLLTDNPADSVSFATPQTDARALQDYTNNLIEGEELMFIMDVPVIPAQDTPIVLAQAATPGATPQPDYILTGCQETESTGDPRSALHAVDPAGWLAQELDNRSNRDIYNNPAALASIKTTLLQGTTHGKITSVIDNTGRPWYRYDAIPDYIGNDCAVFQAEFEGKVYKIVLELHVFRGGVPGEFGASTCPEPTLIKVNGKPVSGALGSDINVSVMDSLTIDASAITVTFDDLAGGAVGQAVGNAITLDTNAAGHNWYIDTTPWDNSEYLPTSNPYEWVAKAGTAAYGKMDMLSVLLHEYGHALGIDHSADNHDYMATTLTPGVRRMPSAEEMALMQQLVAQAKGDVVGWASAQQVGMNPDLPGDSPIPLPIPLGAGFGMAFIGRMRRSSYGGTSIDTVGAQFIAPNPQYAVAANATFANLATPAGWNSQGSVDIASGAATLNEISTRQTRLSQVFMLGEQDRYLSFTLSGTALDDLNGAPDDAFDVALLDANTGANLLGGIGLSHSDAFLNIQGDGTEHTAAGVTRTDNTDGSRTYRVDLSAVAKNNAVNLSFDLLGFGQDNSHVTLSDIRVSGLPQLHDDAAALAEDNLLTFDPFAQADAALRPLLAAAIVTGPTHGAVTVNADGTFAYTPDLDYFGTDSFSYRLSDGPLDSNLATVSLTVTAVNDAPVAADVALTTAEDTALVIALGLYATDVDSAPSLIRGGWEGFATQIVTGPTHGVLTQNADGSYTYTPDANYNGADSFTYKANDGELDSNIATVSLNVTAVNDAPIAADVALTTAEDAALVMNLLAAASDIDGDALTAAIVTGAQHGQVSINADGSFTYTPDANYNGADSFTYRVNDGALDSNIATVNPTIAAVNDAPVAADAALTTLEDTALVIDLFAYAADIDSPSPQPSPASGRGSWMAIILTSPVHGSLVANADGTYSYTPDVNYNGADSFTYKVNDGELDSNIATVTLAISAVNDALTLGDLNLAAVEDTMLAMNLLAQAADIEGDPLTAAVVAGPLHGQISLSNNGVGGGGTVGFPAAGTACSTAPAMFSLPLPASRDNDALPKSPAYPRRG